MRTENSVKASPLWVACLLGLALLVGGRAHAEDFRYLDFRANGLMVNNSTGDTFSGEASWHPSYAFGSDWKAVGIVGLAPLKGESETIILSEFGVAASYTFLPAWTAELGVGMQSWSGKAAVSSSMLNANVLWSLGEPFMGYVDKVFAGYSMVNHEEKTSEIKVGVTVTFGSN